MNETCYSWKAKQCHWQLRTARWFHWCEVYVKLVISSVQTSLRTMRPAFAVHRRAKQLVCKFTHGTKCTPFEKAWHIYTRLHSLHNGCATKPQSIAKSSTHYWAFESTLQKMHGDGLGSLELHIYAPTLSLHFAFSCFPLIDIKLRYALQFPERIASLNSLHAVHNMSLLNPALSTQNKN